MKSTWPTKKLGEEKSVVRPDWEESDFAKTIDGQIMVMLKKAIEDKHYIEAQALSWTGIEQLLLPRLIAWIAKVLKVDLPAEIYKTNIQNLNLFYLCISHDEELYKKLEESRKLRNKVVHKLTTLGDMKSIKEFAKDCTRVNLDLQREIMKRFDGVVLIPSTNLYRNGWNDGLNVICKKLELMKGEIQQASNVNLTRKV